jgi:hypothetical protein
MTWMKVAEAIFTDCYSRRDAAGVQVASHLQGCCFMVEQKEILPVHYTI